MAHTDSVPAGPGAIDNASGVGVLVALAPRLKGDRPALRRLARRDRRGGAAVHGHAGPPRGERARAPRPASRRRARGCATRCRSTWSGAARASGCGRRARGRAARRRARGARGGAPAGRRRAMGARLRHRATPTTASSSSPACPAMVIQVWRGADACYHTACDLPRRLQRGALARVQGVAESVLRTPLTPGSLGGGSA